MREEGHRIEKSRYTAEQVAFAIRLTYSGTAVPEVCQKLGISDQTFYRRKKMYAVMSIAEVIRRGGV